MKVNDIISVIEANLVCGNADRELDGIYVGDLLSRAMSHVESDNVWITIMSNINVVAVATLTEPSAVVLAEGVLLQDDAFKSAIENGITVLSTDLSAYEVCVRLHEAMGKNS